MRSKRFEALDARPVNQDGYVSEWPEVGLIAMDSPNDPKPSIKLSDGKVVELDGKTRDQFDMIDTFVADYGINLELAEKAMAIDSLQVARMLCDINVPRHKIIPLTTAMTPAKLTEVVGNMSVLEMMMAVTKLRARKQPANQCHVTNVADNPVQIAADSAERPLTTADRCDVCDAQAYVRVVMLTGELFFCGHHARKHADKLKEVALLFQDETASLTAGS